MRKIYMNGSFKRGDKDFILYAITEGSNVELFITDMYSHIQSAYKTDKLDEYSYLTSEAKELWKFIKLGITKCSTRKQSTAPVKGLGTVKRYSVEKSPNVWSIDKYDGQFSGCEASGMLGKDKIQVYLCFTQPYEIAKLDYVKLTNTASYTIKNATTSNLAEEFERDFEETVPVRSLAEISLEKDTTWLNNKHYYIVNDEEQAEQIFNFLENYNGIISYDTETTGLCINMFGEIGSERKEKIDAENERLKSEGKAPYKVDRLVGIIFCVEENVSYYFPCFNRKFKNLYSDKSNIRTKQVIDRIHARYTIGDLRDSTTSMSNYIRNTPKEEWQCDVILMERVRDILEKRWLGTHHGSFEYKVGLMYSIDSNLRDDSMLLHQLLYKFRNITASNDRGEPSNLKYLTKVEFGVDQLDLKDFFVDYSEDSSGLSRQGSGSGKKKKSNIDFSYMDYDGAKAYAPADGDFTLGLILKYKNGLMTQFKNQEYLYTVEVIVSCAIGYMEYYGHRLDEAKIEATKVNTYSNMLLTEKKIRDLIDANTPEEKAAFEVLISLKNELSDLESKRKNDKSDELLNKYNDVLHKLDEQNMLVRGMIDTSVNQLNLGSPAQVGELFYDRLGIPVGKDGSKSVNKRAIKPLAKAKDENMNLKYPVVKYYMDWKNDSTLLTKFFDNLPNYMYPGGFIFSGYGQITTATGRMSCSKPNAQQYPHSVTCMVIPRDGCVFADADYSQIEYRTLTALAKETRLMERFKDPDMDYHTVMASLMFDTPYANVTSQMRSEAKTFNFGIPYGMGIKKLAFQLKGSEDASAIEEAKEKYELYFKEQPNVRRFFEDVKEGARVYNYTQTKWGRRRYYSFNDENGKLDTRKMGAALRQAANATIQGTAADIFKIGAARNFLFLRENKLFGKYFITNMVHDEQLVEISCDLNIKVILANLIKAMELKIDGFPPLFVGAGIGATWDDAKGKMAEIHPLLGREFVAEVAESKDSLYATDETRMTPDEVYDYFAKRNYKFREQKILNYILDEKNYGETLDPIIGSTLVLQFDYGVKKELKERFPDGQEGITYTKEEKEKAEKDSPLERLKRFIEAHGLDISIDNFKSSTVDEIEPVKEEEEEEGYSDGDDEDDSFDFEDELINSTFKLIDESSEYYGCSLKDLINEFGFVISKSQKVVGIAWNKLTYSSQKQIQDYLNKHICDESTPGAYRVLLLNNLGKLKPEPHEPQLYVSAVTEEQFMSKVVLDEK